jgi:hypothetical protein
MKQFIDKRWHTALKNKFNLNKGWMIYRHNYDRFNLRRKSYKLKRFNCFQRKTQYSKKRDKERLLKLKKGNTN